MKCVVATIKRWNIAKYHEIKAKSPDIEWSLIDRKEGLTLEALDAINPDYVFFPHWSWGIPEEIFSKYECVVFHPGDLPDGRGSSLIQHRIKSGVYHTKVSALKVNKGFDTGDIYIKKDLCLNGSGEEIYLRLTDLIFDEMIPYIIESRPQPIPQVGKSSFFRCRKPEMSELPQDMTLKQVHDFIRMLEADSYPPAFIKYGNLRIEFSRSSLHTGEIITDARIRIE